jgi:cob(I)alamin adenosyltransferase
MVYINKVYTRFGDKGDTMLANGATVSKSSARVQSYGDVDELNACLGMLRLEISRSGTESPDTTAWCAELDATLQRIQQELFNLGAELATPDAQTSPTAIVVEDRHIKALEAEIDARNARLAPLTSFILPGGGPVATVGHLARTVCRRAERHVVTLMTTETVRPETQVYLNRLSDLLFVLSRDASHEFGAPEVLWNPKTT